ncbi:MAG: nucleotidyltransferase domain-containing protein [Ruminococcus sp.]|jgi:predicted nucleotidyltransferase|nr:nucleotidyltransferase domain-containing protein [Ruminococcus sp.]
MIYTIDEIKERIRPVAEKYNLPAVYLFGSYARGEADEKSDIDLMIDRTGTDVVGVFRLGGVFGEFRDSLETEIDMITTDVFKHEDDRYFTDNVKKDMVNIYVR